MTTLPTYFAALLLHVALLLSVTDIKVAFAFQTFIPRATRSSTHWLGMNMNMNSDEATNSNPPQKAPMYITIGPQCAGKTTLLQTIQQNKGSTIIHDVTIDDQRDVYVKVPTRLFLVNHVSQLGKNQSDSDFRLLNQAMQHKTISQRIYDESNDEMRAVLQRLLGILTKEAFEKRIIELYSPIDDKNELKKPQNKKEQKSEANPTPPNSNTTTPIHSNASIINPGHMSHAMLKEREQQERNEDILYTGRTLVQVVEKVLEEIKGGVVVGGLPETVQLFVLENIFRPHPVTKQSAVDSSHAQLQNFAANSALESVAWGNTNTRPREYKEALEVAARNQRPVYFLLYADQKALNVDNGIFMPHTTLSELVRRNIMRLLQTGKYVPARAIFDASSRVENLAMMALDQLQRQFQEQNQPKQEEMEVSCDDNADIDTDKTKTELKAEQSTPASFTKFDLDVTLARLANYKMNENRTINKMPQPFHQRRKQQRDRDRNENSGRGRSYNDRRNNNNNNGRGGRGSYQQPSNRRMNNNKDNDSNIGGYNTGGNRGRGDGGRYNDRYRPQQQRPPPGRDGGWRQDRPSEYCDRHGQGQGQRREGGETSWQRDPPRGEYRASNPRGGWNENNRAYNQNQNNTAAKNRFQNNNNKHSAPKRGDDYQQPPAKRTPPSRKSNNGSRNNDGW